MLEKEWFLGKMLHNCWTTALFQLKAGEEKEGYFNAESTTFTMGLLLTRARKRIGQFKFPAAAISWTLPAGYVYSGN